MKKYLNPILGLLIAVGLFSIAYFLPKIVFALFITYVAVKEILRISKG